MAGEYADYTNHFDKVIVKSGPITVKCGDGKRTFMKFLEPGKSESFCKKIAEQELEWRSQAKVVVDE